ncbi:MAG: membrane or secreted protein [Bacteroidales bacterium]|nr:membrane or secreted protein [Bacteroidales bacterium]
MMTFLKVMLMAVLLVGLAWIGIAIKMFLQKNGRFTKSCGSVDPVSGKPIACSCEFNKPETCEKL